MAKMIREDHRLHIGHLRHEIQVDRLNNAKGVTKPHIKPQVDKYTFAAATAFTASPEGTASR